MMAVKAPKLVRDWCREHDVELSNFSFEYESADWRKISEDLDSEEKYCNVSALILEYVPTARFFRCWTYSLPYGMQDQLDGLESFTLRQNSEIEEVWPQLIVETEYLTKKERAKALAKSMIILV
jgi:hypothetical protein